jgi:hypothetical protein
MTKKSSGCVINLSEQASLDTTKMIQGLRDFDSSVKVSHTKLVSFIVSEYEDKYFVKNQKSIAIEFRDSKKQITGKLTELSRDQLLSLSKYIEKIKIESNKEVKHE